MNFLSKVGIFLGFVLFVYAWLAAVAWIQRRASALSAGAAAPPAGPTYLFSTFLTLAFPGLALGSVWILSDFFDIVLTSTFVIVGQLSLALQYFTRSIVTSPDLPVFERRMYFTFEVGLNYPIIAFSFFMISALCFSLIVPIMCGFAYFGNEVPSDRATKQVFTIMFGLASLMGVLFTAGFQIPYISSRNVDAKNRLTAVTAQFAGLGSTLLTLAVFFWSLEIPSEPYTPILKRELLSASSAMSISPLLLATLLAYIFAASIVPFVVGSRRAALWQRDLLNRQRSWLEKLSETLRYPTPTLYPSKLDKVTNEILIEKEQFISADKFLALIFDDTEKGSDLKRVVSWAERCQSLNPRLQYIGFLKETLELLKEVGSELARKATDREKIDYAGDFAKNYKEKAADISDRKRFDKGVTIPAVATFIIMGLMTGFIQKVGEVAYDRALATLTGTAPN